VLFARDTNIHATAAGPQISFPGQRKLASALEEQCIQALSFAFSPTVSLVNSNSDINTKMSASHDRPSAGGGAIGELNEKPIFGPVRPPAAAIQAVSSTKGASSVANASVPGGHHLDGEDERNGESDSEDEGHEDEDEDEDDDLMYERRLTPLKYAFGCPFLPTDRPPATLI
jgi:hypothetical protein